MINSINFITIKLSQKENVKFTLIHNILRYNLLIKYSIDAIYFNMFLNTIIIIGALENNKMNHHMYEMNLIGPTTFF